ncbi:hypothetical protein RND61_15500 [Streptomyces sp. TRM76323]|uniref:Uncharacterized protein n=1 Tax=Streptomyces tamarix TaxID=3078565 RepID=A0ABU3QL09_9ACTN|nr:hypothetical protein [Streptomyces tamarix]MDT9683453.1 hypothetical protein [Streptomyces tamarix]
MMYDYVEVREPKITSKSLFSRKGNTTVNIHKSDGKVEVSIAVLDGYFPAFDIKLIDDKLWSRKDKTLSEYTYYYDLLSRVRDSFPDNIDGFGRWEERVRQ